MKKLIISALCVILLLSLTSCKDEIKTDTTGVLAPESFIDPETIDWGYDEETNDSERWYLQGTDDVVYIYFTTESDKHICTYNLVESGVVVESDLCVVTKDKHLVPIDGSTLDFDIVFEDCFNAYDYSKNSKYSRGNADEYNSYFKSKTFIDENGETAIVFSDENTYEVLSSEATEDSPTLSGTWEVVAQKSLLCKTADKETLYKIRYNDDMTIKSIENDNTIYFSQYSEDETVNKYKAY